MVLSVDAICFILVNDAALVKEIVSVFESDDFLVLRSSVILNFCVTATVPNRRIVRHRVGRHNCLLLLLHLLLLGNSLCIWGLLESLTHLVRFLRRYGGHQGILLFNLLLLLLSLVLGCHLELLLLLLGHHGCLRLLLLLLGLLDRLLLLLGAEASICWEVAAGSTQAQVADQ